MLGRMVLVRINVSDECSSSMIRVTRIGELGTLPVTSNLGTVRRYDMSVNIPEDDILHFYICLLYVSELETGFTIRVVTENFHWREPSIEGSPFCLNHMHVGICSLQQISQSISAYLLCRQRNLLQHSRMGTIREMPFVIRHVNASHIRHKTCP
jgi:hypothetical protein